jgi:hypothetical protein
MHGNRPVSDARLVALLGYARPQCMHVSMQCQRAAAGAHDTFVLEQGEDVSGAEDAAVCIDEGALLFDVVEYG